MSSAESAGAAESAAGDSKASTVSGAGDAKQEAKAESKESKEAKGDRKDDKDSELRRQFEEKTLAELTTFEKAVYDKLVAVPEIAAELNGVCKPSFLKRFMVARNNDFEKTRDMIIASLDWRKKNLPIPYAEVYTELRKGKWFLRGVDKQNHPVVVVRSRLFDPKKRDLQTALRSIIYVIEQAAAAMAPGVTQSLVLYDREGYTRANTDIEFIKALAQVLSANYPETLFLAVVQWFFDAKTRGKVTPLKEAKQFLEYIDAKQLQKPYGGEDTWQFDEKELPVPEGWKGDGDGAGAGAGSAGAASEAKSDGGGAETAAEEPSEEDGPAFHDENEA